VAVSSDEVEYGEQAVAALADREYEQAGDAYTRDAWCSLAEPRAHQDPFSADEKGWIGRGLQSLVVAALAYRVAGRSERALHRGVEGVAVARDLRNALDHPGQRACLAEFVADFKLAGDLEGASEAYEEATAEYEAAAGGIDSAQALATTPLFEAAAGPLQQVARSTANGEIAVTWDQLHGADPSRPGRFLAHRTEFKRNRFPSLLAELLESGYLAAPRGTTEYGNEQYRCPECGSADVNWTGDSVLCLRCSTRMVRE
jgi:hypothetical protein